MKYPSSVIFILFYVKIVMHSFTFLPASSLFIYLDWFPKKILFYQKILTFKFFFKNWSFWIPTHFFFNIIILRCMMATDFFFRIIRVSYFIPFYLWSQVTCNSFVLKYLLFGENDNLNITCDNIKFLSHWKVQTWCFVLFCQVAICVCIDFIMWTTCSG